MDLETLVVAIYTVVDDWIQEIQENSRLCTRRGPGRPVVFSDSEVLTLAVLSQYPRWRSERDFWRFADVYLREYFPNLLSQGQLNRRIRALEPELRAFQRDLAGTLADGSEICRVIDTTLVPAIVGSEPAARDCSPARPPSAAAPPRPSGSTASKWHSQ